MAALPLSHAYTEHRNRRHNSASAPSWNQTDLLLAQATYCQCTPHTPPVKQKTAKPSTKPTKSTCIFKPDHIIAILVVSKAQHSKPCGGIPDTSYKYFHKIWKRATLRCRFTSDGSDSRLNHSRCLNWKRTTACPAVGCKAPGAYTLSQDSYSIRTRQLPTTQDARGQHRDRPKLIDSAIDHLRIPKS